MGKRMCGGPGQRVACVAESKHVTENDEGKVACVAWVQSRHASAAEGQGSCWNGLMQGWMSVSERRLTLDA
eukprot:scaffold129953_cov13-Tisochrysis_lutea.AAC.1